ncbi:MAG: hypothetical protein E5Y32_04070 [Mesorhizobium sp.]|nr:MAG: hypothetical protein E5Y87_07160 [Mesorhizobium sp.]TIL96537.1 MAG: hypothetical protein E5Y73_01500 [Mesorhizobium sp.]TIM10959.1 MAG: hypothetical protein E5Y67_25505 [Mesorhizobium sp.]TIN48585.1 MAG: hypothetical protein E5Y32_04070 [Mesorhizobium sp.]
MDEAVPSPLPGVGAAPHPYPLPVKNGERGIAKVEAAPSPRLRGEDAGRQVRGSAEIGTLCVTAGPNIDT